MVIDHLLTGMILQVKTPEFLCGDFPAIFWQNPAFGRFGQILIATLQLFGALQPGKDGHLFLELDS